MVLHPAPLLWCMSQLWTISNTIDYYRLLFLQCGQALSLMERWQPMDSQGALELLTPRFSHPLVKKYAICQLEQADNEVIHTTYLKFPCISNIFTLFLRNCCYICYSWYRHCGMTLRTVLH